LNAHRLFAFYIFEPMFLKIHVLRFLAVLLIISTPIIAQDIGIGHWQVHLPYKKGLSVSDAGTKVYCTADKGLFVLNKVDNSIERLSKINALSDNEVLRTAYDHSNKVLVVAYENANIDLIRDNQVINLPDIKRNNISADKKIYNISFKNNLAYLSCGFGIVVINLDKNEIKDSYIIGQGGTYLKINAVNFDANNNIYALSDTKILKASLNNPLLNDYTQWINVWQLGPSQNYVSSVFFAGDLFTIHRSAGIDSLMRFNGISSSFIFSNPLPIRSMQTKDNFLSIALDYAVIVLDQSLNTFKTINFTNYEAPLPMDAVTSSDAITWIADLDKGLVKVNASGQSTVITPNGPGSLLVNDFDFSNDKLYVSHGPKPAAGILANAYLSGAVSSFDNSGWFHFNNKTTLGSIAPIDSFYDVTAVAVNPNNADHFYVAAWNTGVYEVLNKKLIGAYNSGNSTLQQLTGAPFIRIDDVAFDENGNVWVSNSAVPNVLSVKKTDGNWKGFSFPTLFNQNYMGKITFDEFGKKWVIINGGGILVFDDNGTIDNTADDKFKKLTAEDRNGKLPSLDVRAVVRDKEDALWVGTAKGVAVFYNPGSVFSSSNFDAQQILIFQDGYYQYLLESEVVTSIAIDGANRKWFGTQNGGVFLMSPDGTKQLANFNTSNSPILSNNILSIGINEKTGEVFFGTDKGIIAYRSDATEGSEECNSVKVFPNPVRETYEGPIAISGLAANASVKITDISGALVYETTANGGTAIWNGKNFSGTKMQTGVYVVLASDEDGQNTCVSKILLIH